MIFGLFCHEQNYLLIEVKPKEVTTNHKGTRMVKDEKINTDYK